MAKMVCQSGPKAGHEHPITKDVTVFGRQSACDVQIQDGMASRAHFHVRRDGRMFTLVDLGSRNGTSLNGKKVAERKLEFGDRIRVGEVEYLFVKEPGDLELKDLLTKYELGDKLGEGGMGIVYKAVQRSMARTVALKILSPKYAQRPKFVDQFIREARAAGQLNHPNIVQVHDVGTENDVHYFSMEYIDGSTCMQLLRADGAFEVGEALEIVRQVAKALEYAHEHRLIHQDIKPDNIMVGANNLVKVADLGISKTFDEVAGDDGPKKVMGTPHYMAPEAALGKKIDHRVDLYSLGATMFHLLTGKTPYHGASATEVLKAHVMDPIPSLAELNPDVPSAVVEVVERLLAKNPDERFQHAADVIAAIDAAKEASHIAAAPAPGGDTMILRRFAKNATPTGANGPDATTNSGGVVQLPPPGPRGGLPIGWIVAAVAAILAGLGAWKVAGSDRPAQPPPQPTVQAQAPQSAQPQQPAPSQADARIVKALSDLRTIEEQLRLKGERADLDAISAQAGPLGQLDLPPEGRQLHGSVMALLKQAIEARRGSAQAEAYGALERDLDKLAEERNYDLAVKRLDAFPGRNGAGLKDRVERKRASLLSDKQEFIDGVRLKMRSFVQVRDAARLRELLNALPQAFLGTDLETELNSAIKQLDEADQLRWSAEVAQVGGLLAAWKLDEVAARHRDHRMAMGQSPAGKQFDAYKDAASKLADLVKALGDRFAQRSVRYAGKLNNWPDPDLIAANAMELTIRTKNGVATAMRWHTIAPADLTAVAATVLGKDAEPFRAALDTLSTAKVATEK